jgi:hypothetical protein
MKYIIIALSLCLVGCGKSPSDLLKTSAETLNVPAVIPNLDGTYLYKKTVCNGTTTLADPAHPSQIVVSGLVLNYTEQVNTCGQQKTVSYDIAYDAQYFRSKTNNTYSYVGCTATATAVSAAWTTFTYSVDATTLVLIDPNTGCGYDSYSYYQKL